MIVLDASALIDLVLDQPAAGWVWEQISEGGEARAPAHQPAEVLSAVSRWVRTGQLTPDQARSALDEALSLPRRLIVPKLEQVRRAFALREGIRVMDGLHVTLADELGRSLVTTNLRLAGSGAPCEIRVPPRASG
ncbi:MAG: type II toxin-antitoxin system VapC family toxin [Pseudonocardia sp.]|nr:type II toxin-antitoxin system VapC family toxin [Pseudonocardia sp.]